MFWSEINRSETGLKSYQTYTESISKYMEYTEIPSMKTIKTFWRKIKVTLVAIQEWN